MMIKSKYYYICFLLLLGQGAYCQDIPTQNKQELLYTTIIGDTDHVNTFYLNYSPCGSPINGVNWYGPYDPPSPFKWVGADSYHPSRTINLLLIPTTTDTVTDCREFEIFYGNPIPKGCNSSSGRFSRCAKGFGIKPDSMILVRPRKNTISYAIDTVAKYYTGKVILNLTNNTESYVTIKSITCLSDSLGKIEVVSIKDRNNNTPTSLRPFVQKDPITISFRSRINPSNLLRTFLGTIQFKLTRMEVDSLYFVDVSHVIPEFDGLGLVNMTDSLKFNQSYATLAYKEITLKKTGSFKNFRLDSLPYPFKVTTVTESDSTIVIGVNCGPAVSGKYAEGLRVHFTVPGYGINGFNDEFLISVSAAISAPKLSPDSLIFISQSNEKQFGTFHFFAPESARTDSLIMSGVSYPHSVQKDDITDDTISMEVVSEGVGGNYFSALQISVPVTYYDTSYIQKLTYRIRSLVSAENDSVYWVLTKFPSLKPVTALAADSSGNLFAVSDSIYISQDTGLTWKATEAMLSTQLLCYQDTLFSIVSRQLLTSKDNGDTWKLVDGILGSYYGIPPQCPERPTLGKYPVDKVFIGKNKVLYTSNGTVQCGSRATFKSEDVGITWANIEYSTSGGLSWSADSLGKIEKEIILDGYVPYTQIPFYGADYIANTYGVWKRNSSWVRTALVDADVINLFPFTDSSLIAFTNGRGCFISDSKTENWYGLNGGLTTANIRSAMYHNGRYWLGTGDSGLWVSRKASLSSVLKTPSHISPNIVFPNPATNLVSIATPYLIQNSMSVSLLDVLGNTVFTTDTYMYNGKPTVTLVRDNLQNGLYYLSFLIDGKRYIEKLLLTD